METNVVHLTFSLHTTRFGSYDCPCTVSEYKKKNRYYYTIIIWIYCETYNVERVFLHVTIFKHVCSSSNKIRIFPPPRRPLKSFSFLCSRTKQKTAVYDNINNLWFFRLHVINNTNGKRQNHNNNITDVDTTEI